MSAALLGIGVVLSVLGPAFCQVPPDQPTTLSGIGRASSWPHIGAPPSDRSPAARSKQWLQERAAFDRALEIARREWSGEPIKRIEDLRFQVIQYEDAIRTVTAAGGYGNLILADSFRRLDLALIARYLVMRPSEYAVIHN